VSDTTGSVARYFAFLSRGSAITLLALNFMWAASAATASTCCSVDCSSDQNSSAAVTRRSAGIRFHNLDGRNSLKSWVIRRF
jgi:hypothetical protein